MTRARRRGLRGRQINETDRMFFERGWILYPDSTFAIRHMAGPKAEITWPEARLAWDIAGAELTAEFRESHPGCRPAGWWWWDGPVNDIPEGSSIYRIRSLLGASEADVLSKYGLLTFPEKAALEAAEEHVT